MSKIQNLGLKKYFKAKKDEDVYLHNGILFTGHKYEWIAAKIKMNNRIIGHYMEWKIQVVEDLVPFLQCSNSIKTKLCII